MKAKISAEKFYEKIYDIIGEESPLGIDCGKLCNKACCAVTDEITGMYLFPHEKELYKKLPVWAKMYDTDFVYNGKDAADLFTCNGKCKREQRPLSCRIFPLIPYAHRGEKMQLVMDIRGKGMCPLATALSMEELEESFVKKVKKAMEACMCVEEIREFVYALTEEADELKKLGNGER